MHSNSNVVPLTLRPHLVSFLLKEMIGEERTYAGYKCKIIDIPRRSYIYNFLLEKIEKTDYPLKNISAFNIYLDVKAKSRKRFIAKGKFFQEETMGRSFVYLPQEYMEEVNDLFEHIFRNTFYSYVTAKAENNEAVTSAILSFIDKYELFEAHVSQPQLRQLYYRIKASGICASLQGKLKR